MSTDVTELQPEDKVQAQATIILRETEDSILFSVEFDPDVTEEQKAGTAEAPEVYNIAAMAAMAIMQILNNDGEPRFTEPETESEE